MRRLFLVVLLMGATGWAIIRHYSQQKQLHQQLEQLTTVLTAENDYASRITDDAISYMEEAAAKNRNQPVDRVLVHRAKALQACAKQVVGALRSTGDRLRRATGNPEARPLQHLGASIGTALSHDAPHQQTLARQLTAYADTLRLLKLLDARVTPLPVLTPEENTPVTEALADLARLESEVLAQQTQALQRISAKVGARRWLTHPLAIATAESNVVAPGDTYRAQLGLAGYFSGHELRMHMTCDGRPVPTGPNGVGLVGFRAPTKPGPASWVGKIRINANGRDTTFVVRVPYRVARR